MKKYQMMVFTNPVAGKEDEFNRWYDDRHIPDVLAIPGFVSASRFRSRPLRGTPPRDYLTVYEIHTDDIAAVLADLKTRSRTDLMPISDALAEDSISYVFEAMGGSRTE